VEPEDISVKGSNTQPVLVLRFEGKDQKTVERIRTVMEGAVEAAKSGIR